MSRVGDVAVIMAQLFELRYNSIGYLFHEEDLSLLSGCQSEGDAVEPNIVILG